MGPLVLGAFDVLWLPILGAGFGIGFLIEYLRRRLVEEELAQAGKRLVKERERVAVAERELAGERARATPLADAHDHLLAALSRSYQDLATARDRATLLQALAAAVERVVDPSQFMVFASADRTGNEFLLAAAGGERGTPWAAGARLNDTMGRLGLVARRRIAMDRRRFESEPPIVREQLAATEPPEFLVEVAVPIVVAGHVTAIVSVGGSTLPLDATRGGLELLAAHAASLLRAIDAGARIERLKNTDEMTGLGSKGWFVAEGAEAIYKCRTDDQTAALIVFGIDDFRGYVGRLGHAAGDRLLKGVADVLRPLCGENQLLAHWSGAEFVALLPGCTAREGQMFADKLRAAVSATDWPGGAGQQRGRLTMSAGVASFPASGANLDELIEVSAESLFTARWDGDATHLAEAAPLFDERITQELAVTTSPESGLDPKE